MLTISPSTFVGGSQTTVTGSVAFSGLSGGAHRTVLVGGAPDARGEVEGRARNTRKTFRFEPGGARTVAVTSGVDWAGW